MSKEQSETQVVIMAAGSGKRFGSDEPKALARIGDKTLLQHCTEMFLRDGFDDIAFILGFRAEQMRAHALSFLPKARFQVEKRDSGRGNAMANGLRSGVISRQKRAMITFPDDFFLMPNLPSFALIRHLFAVDRHKAVASIVLAPGKEWPFGVAAQAPDGMVTSFVEKPFVPSMSSVGFMILEPKAFEMVLDFNKPYFEFEKEILPRFASAGLLNGVNIPDGVWYPMDTQSDYESAKRAILEIKEEKVPTEWPK